MRSKKVWTSLGAAGLAVAVWGFYRAETRGLYARNAAADLRWFLLSLQDGNDRAVAEYLQGSGMTQADCESFLSEHRESLRNLDLDALDPTISLDGDGIVATFEVGDGLSVVFHSRDDGERWTFRGFKHVKG